LVTDKTNLTLLGNQTTQILRTELKNQAGRELNLAQKQNLMNVPAFTQLDNIRQLNLESLATNYPNFLSRVLQKITFKDVNYP
jgi:hypothetical protein